MDVSHLCCLGKCLFTKQSKLVAVASKMILFYRHFKKCCTLANISSTNNLRHFSLSRSLLSKNSTKVNVLNIRISRNFGSRGINLSKIQNVPKVTQIKPKTSEYKRLLALAKKEKWVILAGVSFLFVSSGITMLVPFSLGKILDIIYAAGTNNDEAKAKLDTFCLTLCGIFLVGGLANFARVYLFSNACESDFKPFDKLLIQQLYFSYPDNKRFEK